MKFTQNFKKGLVGGAVVIAFGVVGVNQYNLNQKLAVRPIDKVTVVKEVLVTATPSASPTATLKYVPVKKVTPVK